MADYKVGSSAYVSQGKVPPGKCYSLGNPVFSCAVDVEPALPPTTCDHSAPVPGYEVKPVHPMYRTTSAVYGSQAPNIHTMPITFHAKSQKFSRDLGKCGMPRNYSLNCASDQTRVPYH